MPNSAYLVLRYLWCLALLLLHELRLRALQFAWPSFLLDFKVFPIEIESRLFLSLLAHNRKSLCLLWLAISQTQTLLLNISPPKPDSPPVRLGGQSKFRLPKVVSSISKSGVSRQFQSSCQTFANEPRAHYRLIDCSTLDLAHFDRVFV